jgi:hypothetical protein
MCDFATGAMVYMEVQEEKDAKRDKMKYAVEHDVFATFVQRMAEGASVEGMTLFGDAWFGSLKVKKLDRTRPPYMPLLFVGWALTYNIPHACCFFPCQNEAPLYRCCKDRARPLSKGFPSRTYFFGTCKE